MRGKARRKLPERVNLIEYCFKCTKECTSNCKHLIKYVSYIRLLERGGHLIA